MNERSQRVNVRGTFKRKNREAACRVLETAVRASAKEKLGAQKSAEAIVAEPNLALMTDRVVGSGAREGSREGLNIEPPERVKTCHVVKTDRWITRHSCWSRRASKQLI